MTEDRVSALAPIAVSNAQDIVDKLVEDMIKDGFTDLKDASLLMGMTFVECLKVMALRLAQIDKTVAVNILALSGNEVIRCSEILAGHE